MARASATRWRWPPESCAGFALATSSGRPTSASASCMRRLRSAPLMPLGAQPLLEELADRHPRRERRARVLEHHLRAAAAAAELDRSAVEAVQPGDRAQQRRLAAAALADERDRLAARRPRGRHRAAPGGSPCGGSRCAARTSSSRRRPTPRRDSSSGSSIHGSIVDARGALGARPSATTGQATRPGMRLGRAASRARCSSHASTWSSHRGANGHPLGWSRGSGGSPDERAQRRVAARRRA